MPSTVLGKEQSKALEMSAEVDLRGMTREEALMTLDKYIDDAFLASLPQTSPLSTVKVQALCVSC